MSRFIFAFAIFLCALMTGCATSQNVTLAQISTPGQISSAALVPQEDNAPDMDANIRWGLNYVFNSCLRSYPLGWSYFS